MRNVILNLPDIDKANAKHRSVLENERMNKKKWAQKSKKLKWKLPARVMRMEMGQNIKKQEQMDRKSTKHERIQEMTKKNKMRLKTILWTWEEEVIILNFTKLRYNHTF